ncbi:MAG: type II toxin-antitoxin system RelE/ParE family toxin [Pseudomonadota bacterium]
MTYRLSKKADEDIIRIYLDGAEQFGVAQADAYHASLERSFDFLAENPRAAREREELSPAFRAHPHKAHVILYRVEERGIFIVRVRHAREDWVSRPIDDAVL